MADLEIIGVPFSNYVRSVRLLCEEKGVSYTLTPSRPHTPEVLAISPSGQIPVMRHGDTTLFETKAIATYIDKAFSGAKFIPEDTVSAAKVEQWVSYGNAKVDKWIMREFVVPQAFADKEKGPDMARVNAAVPEIEKCCKAMQDAVTKTGHLAGSALTYADMHVLPMLVTMQAYPIGKEIAAKYPALMAYVGKLTARPSFEKTAPPPRK
jgi:glutathione S-transferase